jgi:hypothetical protein
MFLVLRKTDAQNTGLEALLGTRDLLLVFTPCIPKTHTKHHVTADVQRTEFLTKPHVRLGPRHTLHSRTLPIYANPLKQSRIHVYT